MTDARRGSPPHPVVTLLNALAYLAIAGTIGGFLARVWWPLDVMCHLRFQYFWVLLLLCGPLAWAGCRKHAVVAGGCGLINLALIVPLYFGATPRPPGEPDLRLMAINVLTSNRDYDEVLSIIQQHDPDIVVFSEVDQRWIDGIKSIRATLPHSHTVPRQDNFGIAIYSRLPLAECRFVDLADTSIQAVVAMATISGKDVRIIGAHTLPPVSHANAAIRNRQLRHLARLAAEHTGPTILTGDLNSSSWSPYFQDLLQYGELRDTRQGRGLLHSHSALYLVQMTLDHILVSQHVHTHDRWVAPCTGSDHDAVLADLAF